MRFAKSSWVISNPRSSLIRRPTFFQSTSAVLAHTICLTSFDASLFRVGHLCITSSQSGGVRESEERNGIVREGEKSESLFHSGHGGSGPAPPLHPLGRVRSSPHARSTAPALASPRLPGLGCAR